MADVRRLMKGYLEGHGDLVRRLMTGITTLIVWLIGIINILPKSPLTLQVMDLTSSSFKAPNYLRSTF